MNSTDITGFSPNAAPGWSVFSSEKIGGFTYGIGISIGILLLIITIILASYFCTRVNTTAPRQAVRRLADETVVDAEAGIDEATLMSYPKMLFSEAKVRDKGTTSSCCSICLADYKDTDVLRLLPDCGHLFHLKCVDLWLRLNPTCPFCRTSPLPSPLPTPLAEVVPLARQS